MSILYYLGVTQLVASKMAWAMSVCFGTTAIETLGVVSNIMLNGVGITATQLMRNDKYIAVILTINITGVITVKTLISAEGTMAIVLEESLVVL